MGQPSCSAWAPQAIQSTRILSGWGRFAAAVERAVIVMTPWHLGESYSERW